jgi:hypothetical protein
VSRRESRIIRRRVFETKGGAGALDKGNCRDLKGREGVDPIDADDRILWPQREHMGTFFQRRTDRSGHLRSGKRRDRDMNLSRCWNISDIIYSGKSDRETDIVARRRPSSSRSSARSPVSLPTRSASWSCSVTRRTRRPGSSPRRG